MSDLISRKDAINAIIKQNGTVDKSVAKRILIQLPSAEPEIIRCKDCEWCVEHYDTDWNAPYWICKNWDGGTDADGFCYEAERRTDE